MLSLLLITALAVQYPPPAPQAPSTTRSQAAQKDTATTASRSAPVSRGPPSLGSGGRYVFRIARQTHQSRR
jgi:hypothetical protein